MKKVIYIEKEIKNHIRTKLICNRFKNSEVILIDKYSEIFNKKNQSFRRQKLNPSIIIAKKKNNFLYETPANYGIGNNYNYYFSYMLNCMFDCKYCFLQGLYTSANYVIFVNYEDFLEEIKKLSLKNSKKNITLFSGYDCDSLAFEPVTQFMKYLMNKVNKFNNIELEIRTKSSYTQIFSSKPINNVIIAYSFTPDRFSRKYEIGVPNVEKRIKSLANLSSMGWKVGIRLDPIICYEGWEEDYCELTKNIFKKIDEKKNTFSFNW